MWRRLNNNVGHCQAAAWRGFPRTVLENFISYMYSLRDLPHDTGLHQDISAVGRNFNACP